MLWINKIIPLRFATACFIIAGILPTVYGDGLSYFMEGQIHAPPIFVRDPTQNKGAKISSYKFRIEVYGQKWRLFQQPIQEVCILEPWSEWVFDGRYIFSLAPSCPYYEEWHASVFSDRCIHGSSRSVSSALYAALLLQTISPKQDQKLPNPFSLGRMEEVQVDWIPFGPGDKGPPRKVVFYEAGQAKKSRKIAEVKTESDVHLAPHLTVPKIFIVKVFQFLNEKPFVAYHYEGTITNSGILHQPFPGPPKLPEVGPVYFFDYRYDPNSPIMLWISDHWPSEAEVRRTPEYRRWAALDGRPVPTRWSRLTGILMFVVLIEGLLVSVFYVKKMRHSKTRMTQAEE